MNEILMKCGFKCEDHILPICDTLVCPACGDSRDFVVGDMHDFECNSLVAEDVLRCYNCSYVCLASQYPRETLTHPLFEFLQEYRLVMVEGPRGVGKSTMVQLLLNELKGVYYKTWGADQKTTRQDLYEIGLDITQGTFFVLDFMSQVHPEREVIADRGFITVMSYQRNPYFHNHDLIRYYVSLMKQVKACFVVLDAPVEVIRDRRVARKDDDEQRLFDRYTPEQALEVVARDRALFTDSAALLVNAGLSEEYFEYEGNEVLILS